ncbi:homoprotocatechuate degradation operon regulator HpaR [Pseudodonghicola flavimaris]|uniref:Homoprotocatechuate degradation operon regulator HpaR n=1 Tax=Pseudodonghicola flavimaris TaxID=3050036 RepID=A0ABT7F596_9RHOB|nr:homoprotocatechuate degradation operon regulator HpaR [Pseudodonghicola flavimaris]MDK3019766.1 homoprotocatechuate degradation operon regulator HpaR [Pseudodonghicola flavimaris]
MDTGQEKRLRDFQRALPISLLRAREATMRPFKDHVESYGLTLQQWRVLRALADDSPLDSKTLSERCVILAPSLSRIFRTLLDRGLIHTVKSKDARRHSVILSREGAALFEEASRRSEEIYRRLEAAYGTEKMSQLLTLLGELREVAEATDFD